MYFRNIGYSILQNFKDLEIPFNFSLPLTTILSNVNRLFKVEPISNGLYRIYPLFKCDSISSTNARDKILETSCLICIKDDNKETYITFKSDDNADDIYVFNNVNQFNSINDNLSLKRFNSLVYSCFKHNHSKELNLKSGVITGDYGVYTFDLKDSIIVDNGIMVNDEVLTVKLENPVFEFSEYILKITVYTYSDTHIVDGETDDYINRTDYNIVLENNTIVEFPELAKDSIIMFNASITINHNKPFINHNIEWIELSSSNYNPRFGESITLTAVYYDEFDRPVPNKEITFIDEDDNVIGTVTSDSEGIAELNNYTAPENNYHIYCECNDITSNLIYITFTKDDLNLILTAPSSATINTNFTIDGVVTSDNTPIEGLTFYVRAGESSAGTVTTDSNGMFSKTLSSDFTGEYSVEFYFLGNNYYNSCSNSVLIDIVQPAFDGVTLASDKSILSYSDGESATLTAQLTDSGVSVAVSGESVSFMVYDDEDTLIETLTGTTDATGKTTVSYNSKDTGDIKIKAVCNSIISNEIFVEDCHYFNSTEISKTGTSTQDTIYTINDNILFDLTDFVIDWDSKVDDSTGGGGIHIGSISNRSNSGYNYGTTIRQAQGNIATSLRSSSSDTQFHNNFIANTYYHFKIVKEGNSISYYCDGNLLRTVPCDWWNNYHDYNIFWLIYSVATFYAKNIKIKQL